MMANRPKQSLMDYMVIGISPALIMAMVGSLLFYLLMAFYQGQYGGRLTFIFAMFVMAIVLIARISMERGIEYATLFAIPLAIVTLMAMSRFVQIQGPLASYSMLINVGLIALVWWSAHQLTWDCTLIDDSEDSSGEGLLQGMGFDSDTVENQAGDYAERPGGEAGRSAAGEPENEKAKKSELPLWWQRMVNRRHRPHTPGVWVIYYAIAALPLFALGQWLIPAQDAARLAGFRLLVVYVGSALGLLLTTSFLGLRRYLRQRKLEMPADMASVWLGIGAIMILALLLVCVVLPRPGAALKISQVPVSFASPDPDRTHRNAMGNDGPEKPQQANRTRQDANESGPDAPSQQGAKGKKTASSEGNAKSSGSKSGPKGQGKQSSKSSDGRQNRDGAQNPKSGAQEGKQSGSEDRGDSKASRGKSADKNASAESSDRQAVSKKSAGGAKSRTQNKEAGKGGSEDSQQSMGQQDGDSQQARQQAASDQRSQESRNGAPRGDRPQQNTRQENPQQSQAERDRSSSSRSPSPASSAARALGGLLDNFGAVVKLLFWAVLLCVVAFFAWKYRDRVVQAIRQLMEDLKNLLANLLGGRRDRDNADDEAVVVREAEKVRPFASYNDPFVTGGDERYSAEQLVRYSFEAMEAWGRERGCPRDVGQTPLEFARRLAVDHPNLGVEAQQLADLYSRVAYGQERVSADRRGLLQQLWRHMRSTAAMPAPPPAKMV